MSAAVMPPASITPAELFRGQALLGTAPATLSGVARDSRLVSTGAAYIAQDGNSAHLLQAMERHAGVLVTAGLAPRGVRLALRTPHPRWSFARASCALHNLDRRCPPLIATTGTKGKSTVTHLAWWLLGAGAARVGTIGWHDGSSERKNAQTTPPPDELHGFLAGLPAGCPGVALEASSHGCDQFRLAGLQLAALAVTGIGHDHLDYHQSTAAYVAAKLRAVQLLVPGGLLVLNAADAHVGEFARAGANVGAEVVLLAAADCRAPSPLPGAFNAWNTEAAVRLVSRLGVSRELALERLASMPAIPGRLELLVHAPLTYVDYAHTPESIAAVLGAVRAAHPGKPVAIVFGCGGDRDPSKRAPMGAAAATADLVVITTDNSRSEDPQVIAAQIRAGVGATACVSEPERAAAIRAARTAIGRNGVVVVAGKGHETTQDIGGVVTAWDDRAFVAGLDAESQP